MNRFCIGQVLFESSNGEVVIYAGKTKDKGTNLTYNNFLTRGRCKVTETHGIERYVPYKSTDGKVFKGHLSRIMGLEHSFDGVLASSDFDENLWGLVNHTLSFASKYGVVNGTVKDHVVIKKLPGEV